jgi:hypothetical protein
MPMTRRRPARSAATAAVVAGLGTLLLGACAHLQPPPVPRVPQVPHLGPGGDPPGAAACAPDIAQAHAALAAAGAAAGDPAATASAHAAYATAMAAYHTCLAQPGRP